MNEETNGKNSNNESKASAAMGIVFGGGIGLLFGIIFGGSGMGIAMGLMFGAGVGLIFGRNMGGN